VRESLKGILFHDESNDSLEHQVAEINKNQVQHNLAITVLSSQFRLLQAAITERAG
jgi:flagellar basal-body rod protein FlgB